MIKLIQTKKCPGRKFFQLFLFFAIYLRSWDDRRYKFESKHGQEPSDKLEESGLVQNPAL